MKKIALSLLAVLGAFSLYAQNPEDKEALEGTPSPEVSALRLAADLVKYGYAQQSALPLIDAMQIINETPTQALTDAKEPTEEVTVETADGKGNVTLDFAEIANSAKTFADGDVTLLALITQIENEAKVGSSRGAVGGPKYKVDVVKANHTDVYTIRFIANQYAEVGIIGDGDTDLDLYVYDSNGNLIASDTDYTDDCYVSWTPRWTGNFKIKIVNRGRVANRYVLMTN